MFRVNTDKAIKVLESFAGRLSTRQIATATNRAINRSLETGRTVARRQVRQVYNISALYIDRIGVQKSNPTTLSGNITANNKPISLDAFNPKFRTRTKSLRITRSKEDRSKNEVRTREFKRARRTTGTGVTIEVKKGKPETIPFAFMILGGKPRVFARGEYNRTSFGFIRRKHRVNRTGSDTPVRPMVTVSVFGSVMNDEVITVIGRKVENHYPERLTHEIKHLIDRIPRH